MLTLLIKVSNFVVQVVAHKATVALTGGEKLTLYLLTKN